MFVCEELDKPENKAELLNKLLRANQSAGLRYAESGRDSNILALKITHTVSGPVGAVATLSANGLVGTGFVSLPTPTPSGFLKAQNG